MESFGMKAPDLDELICFIGPPLRESFQRYCSMSQSEAEMAVDKYRERFSAVGKFENRVIGGILPMLEKLKRQGKIMAVATSKPFVFAEQILEKYGLAPYFPVVVGSELDGTRDAKEEVILEALRRLGLPRETKEAVMIGDRKHDILGAKKMRSRRDRSEIWICRGRRTGKGRGHCRRRYRRRTGKTFDRRRKPDLRAGKKRKKDKTNEGFTKRSVFCIIVWKDRHNTGLFYLQKK